MMSVGVHGCTDITGFGFLGHAAEMLEETENSMVIDSGNIPFFPEAKALLASGFVPGGLYRNRDFRKGIVEIGPNVPDYLGEMLYDPQTSGGLLMAVSKTKAARLLQALRDAGVENAAIVGEVVAQHKGKIIVI